MFTFEDFKSLAGITDRDELMSAVAQVPEEDLRTALFFTLLACGKNIEINRNSRKLIPTTFALIYFNQS